MLAVPKLPFIVIGFLESIAVVSGMYAGGTTLMLLTFQEWPIKYNYKSKENLSVVNVTINNLYYTSQTLV